MTIEIRQKLENLEAAVKAQLQTLYKQVEHLPQPQQAHQLVSSLNITDWAAEQYEGRAGAPTVPFTRVQQVATELREEFDETGELSFAQQMALDYLTLMLA